MPEPRTQSYKFQRLRESIRRAIESGELSKKLPGERELARRFGVNAKTVSKALTDLSAEGLLVRQIGRGTFVAGQDYEDRVLGTRRQYAWLCSKQVDAGFMQAMYSSAKTRFEVRGHYLELQALEVDERGEIPDRCMPIAHLKELAGLIIFSSIPSRALLSDFCRRHLPVVLCNTFSRSIKINAVTADYTRGVFDLTEHLIQLGHVEIRLVIDRLAPCVAPLAQRGYQTALTRYGLEGRAVVRCPSDDPSAILALSPSPTAIVCVGGSLAGELKRLCRVNNRQIPEQLSLTAMPAPGQLSAQQQNITTYDIYPDHILDWTMQILFESTPGGTPREVIVPGVFNDRGSTAPLSVRRMIPEARPVAL